MFNSSSSNSSSRSSRCGRCSMVAVATRKNVIVVDLVVIA